jgi:alkylation response protein AidB-like acyl-CoA dehydrogenase
MALLEMTDSHSLVAEARGMTGLLRSARPGAEESGHMAPEVRQAFGRAGMFRLAAPREVGGHEVRLPVMAAILHELAVGDPGAAWHLANSPMAGLVAASLSPSARERVFDDPEACYSYSAIPGGRAVPIHGGVELSGRWPFVTGIRDARWVVLSAMLIQNAEAPRLRDLRLLLVPAEKVTIEDTWSGAAALRSSGSNAVRVEGLFVEDDLIFSFTQPRLIDRSLYRLPASIVFTASASTIAVGVLRAALDATISSASTKMSSLTGSPWSDHTHVRVAVARAEATHHSIRAGLFAALDQLQDDYEATTEVAPIRRALAWATMHHAVDEARRATSSLAGSASSQAFMTGHGFEAAVRDIHAIPVALENMRPLEQAAGGVLLGAPPDNPIF